MACASVSLNRYVSTASRSVGHWNETTKKRISATVNFVSENFLKLSSRDLGFGGNITLSRPVASTLLTRAFLKPWPNVNVLPDMKREFRIGDQFILDVFVEGGGQIFYNPLQVHKLIRPRDDGVHVNSTGMIINMGFLDEAQIRCCEIPEDVGVPIDQLRVTPECDNAPGDFLVRQYDNSPRIGSIVVFEAVGSVDLLGLYDQSEYRGLSARILPSNASRVGYNHFPNAIGTVIRNETNGLYYVDLRADVVIPRNLLPINRQLPVNDLCYQHVGNGVRIQDMLNDKAACFVCAREPHTGNYSNLEVVSMEPYEKGAVHRDAERWPARTNEDNGKNRDYRADSQGFRGSQACRYFNSDIDKKLRHAFLFFAERADPARFKLSLAKFPHFYRVVLQETGLTRRPGRSVP